MDDAVRIGAAATALGVSIDTLRRWERSGRITFERRGQQRWLPQNQLAVLLRARRGSPVARGSRNRLAGIVVSVRRVGGAAEVELVCGPHVIVALVTGEAAERLDVGPGDSAVAVIEPAAVAVERP